MPLCFKVKHAQIKHAHLHSALIKRKTATPKWGRGFVYRPLEKA